MSVRTEKSTRTRPSLLSHGAVSQGRTQPRAARVVPSSCEPCCGGMVNRVLLPRMIHYSVANSVASVTAIASNRLLRTPGSR